MPAPRYRSRSRRKVFVKTASQVKIHYRKRKPSKPLCPDCGKDLKGIARVRATKLKTLAKTEKVPSRKFGNFCSSCSRKKLITRAQEIKW